MPLERGSRTAACTFMARSYVDRRLSLAICAHVRNKLLHNNNFPLGNGQIPIFVVSAHNVAGNSPILGVHVQFFLMKEKCCATAGMPLPLSWAFDMHSALCTVVLSAVIIIPVYSVVNVFWFADLT